MASTSVPMRNMDRGYTIVTQVIPQATATAATGRAAGHSPLKTFLKGEPKALGTVQIMIGLMTIMFGIVASITQTSISVYSGVSFWGSLFYIIAGSLTVAASNKLIRCLVNGSLVLNVLSTISAGIAIIFFSLDVAIGPLHFSYYNYNWSRGTSGVLLVFSVLQFTISIAISAFACKASCTSEPPVNIVTVVPHTEEGHPGLSVFPTANSQQEPYAFSSIGMNCPPAENPPPYEMKDQPVN